LKAKPDANHENVHPVKAWSCQLCYQHCAPPPIADLVSNPTPPGQITRELASSVSVCLRPRFWQTRKCHD
jgi:hypothetical protein